MKKNIIIDFDNTLANSSETTIKHIWSKYPNDYKDMVYHDYELLWNFKPFIKDEHVSETLEYMSSKEFFEELSVAHSFDETEENAIKNLKSFLSFVSNDYNIILCTNRSGSSFDYVKDWLKKKDLDKYFTHKVCVSSFDKSVIVGSIIIDDKLECLNTGSRDIRIVFGNHKYTMDEFSKNKNNNSYLLISNWSNLNSLPKSFLK